jgi:hypothetical protein
MGFDLVKVACVGHFQIGDVVDGMLALLRLLTVADLFELKSEGSDFVFQKRRVGRLDAEGGTHGCFAKV